MYATCLRLQFALKFKNLKYKSLCPTKGFCTDVKNKQSLADVDFGTDLNIQYLAHAQQQIK